MINPKIIEKSKETILREETYISLPNCTDMVKRIQRGNHPTRDRSSWWRTFYGQDSKNRGKEKKQKRVRLFSTSHIIRIKMSILYS